MNKIKRVVGVVVAACLTVSLLCGSVFAVNAADYPVEIHVMTLEERNDLFDQPNAKPTESTAYLSRNNQSGTNGSICAPFTADQTGVAFVLTSAPGAINYNAQLYEGKPGAGEKVSNYAKVEVNNGVYFTDLTVGSEYYFKISSSTLVTSGCTARYSMVAFDAPSETA